MTGIIGGGSPHPLLAAVLGVGRQALGGTWRMWTDWGLVDGSPHCGDIGGDNYGEGLHPLLVAAPESRTGLLPSVAVAVMSFVPPASPRRGGAVATSVA